MKIILKSLTLNNFAGSGKENHQFNEHETTVSAANGVGKSRIQNAFIWLLFDKNADDRKDFNIKNTLNTDANRQDHIVAAVLNVNGSDILLEKAYKEKWVKKQGSKTQEKTGNETVYFYDGVPVKKSEYNAKIDALINEDLFKLITNVSFFNKLPWLKQRNIITSLVPEVTDNDVAQDNEEFQQLLATLTNGKTMAEYKSQIASQKKKINEELKGIPVRIDEVRKSMPIEEDFDQIETDIYDKETSIRGVEQEISGGQEQFNKLNEGRRIKQVAINDLVLKRQNLQFELSQAASQKSNEQSRAKVECRNAISNTEKDIASSENEIRKLIEAYTKIDADLIKLREEFTSVNATAININEDDYKCPTCHAPFAEDKAETLKEELIKNFNANKVAKLNAINERGQQLKADKEKITFDLSGPKDDLESLEETLKTLKDQFLELTKADNVLPTVEPVPAAIVELDDEIKALSEQLDVIEPIDQSELKQRKTELISELDSLKLRLSKRETIKTVKSRIVELETKESEYSQQVFDLEAIEFNIAAFDKAKITAVESQVNAKFEKVKFKLFETQENGSEVPSCEATLDSVPYADCSVGQKIIMGLDIINTLSNHHGVSAPVFIDNAESCTLPVETNCQVVKLKALQGQPTLLFS